MISLFTFTSPKSGQRTASKPPSLHSIVSGRNRVAGFANILPGKLYPIMAFSQSSSTALKLLSTKGYLAIQGRSSLCNAIRKGHSASPPCITNEIMITTKNSICYNYSREKIIWPQLPCHFWQLLKAVWVANFQRSKFITFEGPEMHFAYPTLGQLSYIQSATALFGGLYSWTLTNCRFCHQRSPCASASRFIQTNIFS